MIINLKDQFLKVVERLSGRRFLTQAEILALLVDKARLGGIFTMEHMRAGKLLGASSVHNLVPTAGVTYLLNLLRNQTQISAWYVTIFETNTTPLATHTYAAPGYTESTAYAEATRPAWTVAAPSGGALTNAASKARFTINATKTIYGSSLVGGGSAASTKGNTAGGGTLLCSALYNPSRSVISGDTLDVTYQFSAADDGV